MLTFSTVPSRVLPTVTPGYLKPLIPESAPEKPDNWTDVMADIERGEDCIPAISVNSTNVLALSLVSF
jgi:hypothetical protein